MDAETHSNLKRLSSQERFLEGLPKDIRTVLDIGAGAGYHSAWFRDRGLKVTACDHWESAFQFHGEIEFVRGSELLEPGRKFDAVFASHILEHCTDPISALRSWKQHVREGGYLIVIVPGYYPVAVDDHWNIGWNAAQLAVTLVTAGFDCRDAVFTDDLSNVCGWGKLNSEVQIGGFSLRAAIPWLSKGLTKFLREDEYGNIQLFAEASFCRPDGTSIAKPARTSILLPGFDEAFSIDFRSDDWPSAVMFGAPRPLPDPLKIAVLCEGSGVVDLHITFGSGRDEGDFANTATFGVRLSNGFHMLEIVETDLLRTNGNPDLGAIDHIAFGGAKADLVLRAWVMEADGSLWRFDKQVHHPACPDSAEVPQPVETTTDSPRSFLSAIKMYLSRAQNILTRT